MQISTKFQDTYCTTTRDNLLVGTTYTGTALQLDEISNAWETSVFFPETGCVWVCMYVYVCERECGVVWWWWW